MYIGSEFMSESYNQYFIHNESLLTSEEFKDSEISAGTSLYEVVRIIDGVPLFLEKHLQRLDNSAKIINKELWMSLEEIKEKMMRLIEANGKNSGNIKIVFNYRGENLDEHNFFAYYIHYSYPTAEQYENGVKTVLCFMERSNPNAKIINNELRIKSNELIKETGAYEAILVDREGYITEGSRSNIFMVKGEAVYTAPIKNVLPGITRNTIIDICKQEGVTVFEDSINHDALKKLDSLFITGTSPKVLPIKEVGEILFSSASNPIVQKIMNAYNKVIEDYIKERKTS
jgi:branched-chain amino acid aminotransferase